MNNIDIANGMVFNALDIKNDTFENRVISQKRIYLFQSLGLNLGYSFVWYIHGPYSPELTSYMYENIAIFRNYDFSKYSMNKKACDYIDKVNSLSAAKIPEMSEAEWYELLSSIVYVQEKKNSACTYEQLKKVKPQFNEDEYSKATNVLKSMGFISG